MKFHHIGVFVADLSVGCEYLRSIFPIHSVSEPFNDANIGVKVQFLTDSSGISYEVVAPYGEKNPVNNLVRQKKNILNHVAYTVVDLDSKILELKKLGCLPICKPIAAVAFDGRRVVFILTRLGFIFELIEDF